MKSIQGRICSLHDGKRDFLDQKKGAHCVSLHPHPSMIRETRRVYQLKISISISLMQSSVFQFIAFFVMFNIVLCLLFAS